MADTQLPLGSHCNLSREDSRGAEGADGGGKSRQKEYAGTCNPISGFLCLILFFLQTKIGAQLTMLETRWTELISSMLQIEMANVALDAEIDQLNKREADLAATLS